MQYQKSQIYIRKKVKYPKPSLLILYGSLSTLTFGFACTLFVHFFISKVPSYLFFLIPLLGAAFVFIIFNFLLKKFIQHRLAILYRSVQTKQEDLSMKHKEDSLDEMIENAEEKVQQWKRDYVNFEPSRSCAVNTRFQQYLDVILKDLGLNPYRKLPNILAELFSQYGPDDYVDIFEEYRAGRTQRSTTLRTLALDT